MLIEEITIKNLLSFGPKGVTLPLRPLNVLIGANGSGKSNFIDALRTLQAAPTDIWKPINEGGGPATWFHQQLVTQEQPIPPLEADIVAKLGGIASLAKEYVKYEVELRFPPLWLVRRFGEIAKGAGLISHERLSTGELPDLALETKLFERSLNDAWVADRKNSTPQQVPIPPAEQNGGQPRTLLSQLNGPLSDSRVLWAASALSSIAVYGFWQSGRYSALRLPQSRFGNGGHLLADFSNLTLVVFEILADAEKRERFIEAAKWLFDGVTDVCVEPVGDDFIQLVLFENGRKIPAARMSDGTLRFLCLLATLLHPLPPRLICIEEPEIGLHPDLIVKLADLLKEASNSMQLVVTTHSDMLLDALSDTPESIVVCSKEDGETVMSRLDPEELEPYLEEYSLSHLWNSGQLGGRRW